MSTDYRADDEDILISIDREEYAPEEVLLTTEYLKEDYNLGEVQLELRNPEKLNKRARAAISKLDGLYNEAESSRKVPELVIRPANGGLGQPIIGNEKISDIPEMLEPKSEA